MIVYAIQFLLFPILFPQYYPTSNESTIILIAPLILFSVLFNVVITDIRKSDWIIVDMTYGTMIILYNGTGLYGIGMRGISLDGLSPNYSPKLLFLTVLMLVIVLLSFQVLIRTVLLKCRKL